MTDPHTGLPAKYPQYLPTVGNIAEFADALRKEREAEAQADRYAHLRGARTMSMDDYAALRTGRQGYQPFPKLWEAFADDAAVRAKLNARLPFDALFNASRVLATEGVAQARVTLMRDPTVKSPVTGIDVEALFRCHEQDTGHG